MAYTAWGNKAIMQELAGKRGPCCGQQIPHFFQMGRDADGPLMARAQQQIVIKREEAKPITYNVPPMDDNDKSGNAF